ncbi:type II toxin-antitoxin system Phd/YefM family antitoxin [Puniceicoccus vermicola]|uniref:Antitoxin n=1 Tax=Puniceicoccus vermicola TaxID=388746 RepID=A0A7X1AWG0_9BACT|nr:type II toxin-antitoxin system prevent-host-death family antitoxin [Puniceicoccus vermicola]MBC2601231.1 type II toxin-antitoxin system prevent-host-death family antitoxin [Puniceicoccus vermicola]
MASSYTIKTAQRSLSALVRECESHPVTLTRQGKAVAVVMSVERMEAIAETMEVLADPAAMSALRKYRAGEARFQGLEALESE